MSIDEKKKAKTFQCLGFLVWCGNRSHIKPLRPLSYTVCGPSRTSDTPKNTPCLKPLRVSTPAANFSLSGPEQFRQ